MAGGGLDWEDGDNISSNNFGGANNGNGISNTGMSGGIAENRQPSNSNIQGNNGGGVTGMEFLSQNQSRGEQQPMLLCPIHTVFDGQCSRCVALRNLAMSGGQSQEQQLTGMRRQRDESGNDELMNNNNWGVPEGMLGQMQTLGPPRQRQRVDAPLNNLNMMKPMGGMGMGMQIPQFLSLQQQQAFFLQQQQQQQQAQMQSNFKSSASLQNMITPNAAGGEAVSSSPGVGVSSNTGGVTMSNKQQQQANPTDFFSSLMMDMPDNKLMQTNNSLQQMQQAQQQTQSRPSQALQLAQQIQQQQQQTGLQMPQQLQQQTAQQQQQPGTPGMQRYLMVSTMNHPSVVGQLPVMLDISGMPPALSKGIQAAERVGTVVSIMQTVLSQQPQSNLAPGSAFLQQFPASAARLELDMVTVAPDRAAYFGLSGSSLLVAWQQMQMQVQQNNMQMKQMQAFQALQMQNAQQQQQQKQSQQQRQQQAQLMSQAQQQQVQQMQAHQQQQAQQQQFQQMQQQAQQAQMQQLQQQQQLQQMSMDLNSQVQHNRQTLGAGFGHFSNAFGGQAGANPLMMAARQQQQFQWANMQQQQQQMPGQQGATTQQQVQAQQQQLQQMLQRQGMAGMSQMQLRNPLAMSQAAAMLQQQQLQQNLIDQTGSPVPNMRPAVKTEDIKNLPAGAQMSQQRMLPTVVSMLAQQHQNPHMQHPLMPPPKQSDSPLQAAVIEQNTSSPALHSAMSNVNSGVCMNTPVNIVSDTNSMQSSSGGDAHAQIPGASSSGARGTTDNSSNISGTGGGGGQPISAAPTPSPVPVPQVIQQQTAQTSNVIHVDSSGQEASSTPEASNVSTASGESTRRSGSGSRSRANSGAGKSARGKSSNNTNAKGGKQSSLRVSAPTASPLGLTTGQNILGQLRGASSCTHFSRDLTAGDGPTAFTANLNSCCRTDSGEVGYVIVVRCSNVTHVVSRTFAEFQELENALKMECMAAITQGNVGSGSGNVGVAGVAAANSTNNLKGQIHMNNVGASGGNSGADEKNNGGVNGEESTATGVGVGPNPLGMSPVRIPAMPPPLPHPIANEASNSFAACHAMESFLWAVLESEGGPRRQPIRAFLELEWLDGSRCEPAAALEAVNMLLQSIQAAVASKMLSPDVGEALTEMVRKGGAAQLGRVARSLQSAISGSFEPQPLMG